MLAKQEVLLSLQRCAFGYEKNRLVLEDFSIDVFSGESIVLLGANGSGKSTVLKLLAVLYTPMRGTYEAFGRSIGPETLERDPFGIVFRKRLGIVFQNPDAQLFNPTVESELAYGLVQLGLPERQIRERVAELARLFDLGPILSRAPFHLSGGQKKKVAIAAVLATDPDVLLLDEPTAGLDPRSARALLDLIQGFREAKKTLVITTHDLQIVSEVASRVAVLNEAGRVLASGSPHDLLDDRGLLQTCNLIYPTEARTSKFSYG